jgi:coproporphyrinogen III oxidase-like Fe-S oxidoreductase
MQYGNSESVAIGSSADGGMTKSYTNQKHDSEEASEQTVNDVSPVIPSEQNNQQCTSRLGDRL